MPLFKKSKNKKSIEELEKAIAQQEKRNERLHRKVRRALDNIKPIDEMAELVGDRR